MPYLHCVVVMGWSSHTHRCHPAIRVCATNKNGNLCLCPHKFTLRRSSYPAQLKSSPGEKLRVDPDDPDDYDLEEIMVFFPLFLCSHAAQNWEQLVWRTSNHHLLIHTHRIHHIHHYANTFPHSLFLGSSFFIQSLFLLTLSKEHHTLSLFF